MLSRFRFARLLWFVLLVYAFLALDSRYAEAKEGLASWDSPGLEGNPMASDAPYDMNGYTAASRTLPLGTRIAPQEMAQQPNFAQGGAQQPQLPQGAVQQPSSAQGAMQDLAGGGDYLVQPGDTLTDIASRLGTSVDNLARSNGIVDPNVIRSGQVLHLPQSDGIASNFIRD